MVICSMRRLNAKTSLPTLIEQTMGRNIFHTRSTTDDPHGNDQVTA